MNFIIEDDFEGDFEGGHSVVLHIEVVLQSLMSKKKHLILSFHIKVTVDPLPSKRISLLNETGFLPKYIVIVLYLIFSTIRNEKSEKVVSRWYYITAVETYRTRTQYAVLSFIRQW